MEKLGVFGLVEEGTTVLCTDSGDGERGGKINTRKKGVGGLMKPSAPLRCRKKITISGM